MKTLHGFVQGFNPFRMLFGMYGVICFIPCVILGVWTPKGMSDGK